MLISSLYPKAKEKFEEAEKQKEEVVEEPVVQVREGWFGVSLVAGHLLVFSLSFGRWCKSRNAERLLLAKQDVPKRHST